MCFLHLVCRFISGAFRSLLPARPNNLDIRETSAHVRTRLRRLHRSVASVLAVGIFGSTLAAAQTSFLDVTNSSGLAHSSESYGASWGDVNGDGFPDLFVSNHRTTKSMFQNRGNGTFSDITPSIRNLSDRPSADTHGASWADFNNDGTQDLLVTLGTGNPSEWYINRGGKLIFETPGSGLDLDNLGGRLPVWLDYDNDHRLDVLVAQYGGVAKLFHQNTDGTFKESSASAMLLCIRFHDAQLVDVNGY